MFNIGFTELIVILLIAFLVVGPDDLPKVARWLGRNVRKLKGVIRELKEESGWNDIEKEVKAAEKEVKAVKTEVTKDINDIKKDADITSDLKDAAKDLKKETDSIRKEVRSVEKDVHLKK